MKRTTILGFLALFSALAAAGCTAQTGTHEETNEISLVSRGARDGVANDPSAEYASEPAQALELKTHNIDDSQGPHPEPWLDRAGPHPEPWQGKAISTDPDPNAPNGDNKKP